MENVLNATWKKEVVHAPINEYVLLRKADQDYEKYECISEIEEILEMLTSSLISKIILSKKDSNYAILNKMCTKFKCAIEFYDNDCDA